MAIDCLMLLAGMALILGGANFMTDGAAALAKRLGMSDFLVGLTVVSMMTSAPELVVSVTSAFNASTEMAVGNIVGSNIFNILVIVGVAALIKPITVEKGVLLNEIPLVVLSSAVLLVMGSAPWLDGGPMTLTRVDGLVLLLFFIVFMRYTFASAKRVEPGSDPAEAEGASKKRLPLWKAVAYVLGGLAGLVFGGEWFVDGASGIARSVGWSEGLIGLTILAAGTSLPELATSVVAAMKGNPGICLGNVIGSNIFNIFFVLGVTSTIKPLAFGSIGLPDLLVLTGASLLFWIVGSFFGRRVITRAEGGLMVLLYIA
ncbi:MAG: calcium/sodium antiporter, partial [Muribaculaceae bacterium]|nr:calcium/sodium antiporter [Muribaculaceae bacterium]